MRAFTGGRRLKRRVWELFLSLSLWTCRLYAIATWWSTCADYATGCMRVPILKRWIWRVADFTSRLRANVWSKMLKRTSGSCTSRCVTERKTTEALFKSTISSFSLFRLKRDFCLCACAFVLQFLRMPSSSCLVYYSGVVLDEDDLTTQRVWRMVALEFVVLTWGAFLQMVCHCTTTGQRRGRILQAGVIRGTAEQAYFGITGRVLYRACH